MKQAARILLVDDEIDMLNGCSKILRALGHTPIPASSGSMAVRLLREQEFDLVLCDLFMPEVDGMQVLREAKELAPLSPFIIFSAYGTIDRAVSAMRHGAFDFIEKPFEVERLKIVVEKGLRQRQLYCERNNLLRQLEEKFSFDNIIGQSAAMRRVFELVESVAASEVNVLITGDSGTGKELIARSIHARSTRRAKAFVPVNCSAFPENLFEAELFGYEKGAFTGANQRRAGLLEFADGGTFFLDEVCEMPVTLQAKLLRVLQDQKLRHLGGNQLIQVDVRLISASNRDLDVARSQGRLRDDFYYRLNVINIHLPALRERRDDIRLLAEHFLRRTLKSSPKEIAGFSEETLSCFESYDWPGNVRELENVIERAVTLAKDNVITPAELPRPLRARTSLPTTEVYGGSTLVEAKRRALHEVERNYLLEIVRAHRGNVTKAAAAAGVTRRHLHRLLKQHGLDAEAWRQA